MIIRGALTMRRAVATSIMVPMITRARTLSSSSSVVVRDASRPNTIYLRDDRHEVYLVGTAHVSAASAQEVKEVIERVKPQHIMVELCRVRHDRMMSDITNNTAVHYQPPPSSSSSLPSMNMEQLMRELVSLLASGATPAAAMEKVMKSYYTFFRLMGFVPGMEFRVALQLARDRRIPVICGDRDQQVTLSHMGSSILPDVARTAARLLTDYQLKRRLSRLVDTRTPLGRAASGLSGTPTKEQLEAIIESTKDRASISEMTQIMQLLLPNVHQALLTDRDIALTKSLKDAPAGVIVGVVGLAHVDGIEHWWNTQSLSSLNTAHDNINARALPSSSSLTAATRDAIAKLQSQFGPIFGNGSGITGGFKLPNGESLNMDQLADAARRLSTSGATNKDKLSDAFAALFDRIKKK